MIFREIKRNFLSPIYIFLLVAFLVLASISFFITKGEKEEAIRQVGIGEQVNVEQHRAQMKEEKGALEALYNFYFIHPFHDLQILLWMAWIGIFMGSKLLDDRRSGHGAMMVSRMGYRDYFSSNLLAQSATILTVAVLAWCFQVLAAYIWNGFHWGIGSLGGYTFSTAKYVGITFLNEMIVAVYLVIVNAIVQSISGYIQNRYLLMGLPLIGFVGVPMLIISVLLATASTMEQLKTVYLFEWFDAFYVGRAMNVLYADYVGQIGVLGIVMPIVTYTILFGVLTVLHIRSKRRAYL